VERRYGLSRRFEEALVDGRHHCHVPLADVARCAFLMFAQRLPSLNAIEELLRRRGRAFVREAVPSADTMGYAFARTDPAGLREVLRGVVGEARRRKALRHRGPRTPWTVALDGHELFKSFHRCCEECSTRQVTHKEQERTQYYHRMVAAQFVDAEPPLTLDAELQAQGEGEEPAAERVLERVVRAYPWVEVFTADALYCQVPFLRRVLALKRAAIVVLKGERRDLKKDVDGLFATIPPVQGEVDGEEVLWWDVPGFTMTGDDGEELPVRVVRTVLTRTKRQRVGKKWVEQEVLQEWTWVVVGLDSEVDALTIHRLGHARWDQENCGFNEQDRFFAIDHCFHHDPAAILNFILTLYLAAGLSELFFTRNIKDPALRGWTLSGLARLLLEVDSRTPSLSLWAQAP